MKKRLKAVLTLILLSPLSISAAHADDAPAHDSGKSTTAIGIYTLGGEFTNGTPTMRWKPNDRISVDANPIVVFSDSDTDGPAETKSQRYGMNFGIVRNVASLGNVVAGVRFEGGYDYRYDTLTGAAKPFSSRGKGYDYSFGVGPDFEFFLPSFQNISLGAQGVIGYTESYHRVLSTTSSYQKDTTFGFHGAEFTIRYYFQ